jgi:hypothetical protein
VNKQISPLNLSDLERQRAKLKAEYSEVSSRISALGAGRGIGHEERNRAKAIKALFAQKAALRKGLLEIELRISEFPSGNGIVRRLQPVLSLQEAESQLAELRAEHSEVSELIRSHNVDDRDDGDRAEFMQALFMCQTAIRNSIAAMLRRINELGAPGS